MNAFKNMQDFKLLKVLELSNEWWDNEHIPGEQLQARIVYSKIEDSYLVGKSVYCYEIKDTKE